MPLMTERRACEWQHNPISDPVCHRCLGWIVLNNELHCPFETLGNPKPQYQHLVTAFERYYAIQLKLRAERGK